MALVERILESKARDSHLNTNMLESEIDSLVYKLYNLSDEEVKIMENKLL
ncbi:type II restriction endonuclease [Helicobacter monodelphidis]|nr:type II restriction endonuclease [Helicobacter sp. 15-1451]